MKVRIVGDVHGQIARYKSLVADLPASIQLGDMGFRYNKLKGLDPGKHRFIPGNHDYYPGLPVHSLGDWGPPPWFQNGFFVRGAFSIDKHHRREGYDWFREEELTMGQCYQVYDTYARTRPELMLTHDAPLSLVPFASTLPGLRLEPSRTQQLLEALWQEHQPKLWIFGHYHRDWSDTVDGCEFRCLNELSYIDLEAPDED